MMSIIRGLIKAVRPAKKAANPMRFDASGREGEEFEGREMFQQYGFASRPPEGTQCLLVRSGQNIYMMASDGTRYKAGLADGEVAISDKYDNVVHLKQGGTILIESTREITVKSPKAVVDAVKVYLGGEAAAELGGGVITDTAVIPCLINQSLVHVLTGQGSTKVKAAR
jgi:phage gp45-like